VLRVPREADLRSKGQGHNAQTRNVTTAKWKVGQTLKRGRRPNTLSVIKDKRFTAGQRSRSRGQGSRSTNRILSVCAQGL